MIEKRLRYLRIYIHPTAFCTHVFQKFNFESVEKLKFRDVRIKIADTVENPIAFEDSKTPAKVDLQFGRVF